MVELIEPPHIVDRPRVATIGIRLVTPFRGMLAVRDGLMQEIRSWSDTHRVDLGPLFMRLHVVDMAGDMDIEVGAVADVPPLPDGRIRRFTDLRGHDTDCIIVLTSQFVSCPRKAKNCNRYHVPVIL